MTSCAAQFDPTKNPEIENLSFWADYSHRTGVCIGGFIKEHSTPSGGKRLVFEVSGRLTDANWIRIAPMPITLRGNLRAVDV